MEIQNQNKDFEELEFTQINEYIKKNLDYNFQNYDEENEENKFSEILLSDENNDFLLQKKFAFKLDLQMEDWVKINI